MAQSQSAENPIAPTSSSILFLSNGARQRASLKLHKRPSAKLAKGKRRASVRDSLSGFLDLGPADDLSEALSQPRQIQRRGTATKHLLDISTSTPLTDVDDSSALGFLYQTDHGPDPKEQRQKSERRGSVTKYSKDSSGKSLINTDVFVVSDDDRDLGDICSGVSSPVNRKQQAITTIDELPIPMKKSPGVLKKRSSKVRSKKDKMKKSSSKSNTKKSAKPPPSPGVYKRRNSVTVYNIEGVEKE